MLTQQASTTNNVVTAVSNKVEAVKASLAAKVSAVAAAKPAAAAKPVVAATAGKESAKQFPHYDYYAPSVVVS
jgi:hypothetical protein